jgi:ribosomal protein L9
MSRSLVNFNTFSTRHVFSNDDGGSGSNGTPDETKPGWLRAFLAPSERAAAATDADADDDDDEEEVEEVDDDEAMAEAGSKTRRVMAANLSVMAVMSVKMLLMKKKNGNRKKYERIKFNPNLQELTQANFGLPHSLSFIPYRYPQIYL